jgi:hypothetical protein
MSLEVAAMAYFGALPARVDHLESSKHLSY